MVKKSNKNKNSSVGDNICHHSSRERSFKICSRKFAIYSLSAAPMTFSLKKRKSKAEGAFVFNLISSI